jgi:hypothetical protein
MSTVPPDPGEAQQEGTRGRNPGAMGLYFMWRRYTYRHRDVYGDEREGGRDHTASEVRKSVDFMKACCGHGSIAPSGSTEATSTTSTTSTTSAAAYDYAHIRRPCLHIQLPRFFVSSLSRHNSSTISFGRLHDRLSNHDPVLDFRTSEQRHLDLDLNHEHFNYVTLILPTTLAWWARSLLHLGFVEREEWFS